MKTITSSNTKSILVLEYQTILNLLDESFSSKNEPVLDVLISLVKELTKSSISELKKVPKQIGEKTHEN